MADAYDMDLVREFARNNSETAFAELVRRHINLVYSVAMRFSGNPGDAQDVTQAVFIILARKAAGLRARTVLTGWLYETTRFTAIRLLRTQARRQAHEQEAFMQSTLEKTGDDTLWRQLAPHLEAAMSRLAERDRTLLALRFYENKTGSEAAALLGIREEAAHKRTVRALEKLRKFFANRGVNSTAAIIAGAISANSVQVAPVALAKSVAAVAFAKGATASASTLTLFNGALKIMAWAKAKTAIYSGVVVLLVAGTATTVVKGKIQETRQIEEQLAHAGTTQMKLTGTSGTIITGFYIQNDQRIAVSNSLPWSVVGTNVSQFEFHTTKPHDSIALALVYDGNGTHASMREIIDSKYPRIQVKVENGFIATKYPN